MSSNFEAMNIVVTPVTCRSDTSFDPAQFLKYLSKRLMAKKKVWSSHRKFVKTSIIQSTILALRAGVILCRVKHPELLYSNSRFLKYLSTSSARSALTLIFCLWISVVNSRERYLLGWESALVEEHAFEGKGPWLFIMRSPSEIIGVLSKDSCSCIGATWNGAFWGPETYDFIFLCEILFWFSSSCWYFKVLFLWWIVFDLRTGPLWVLYWEDSRDECIPEAMMHWLLFIVAFLGPITDPWFWF